jgi:hypothetical protein
MVERLGQSGASKKVASQRASKFREEWKIGVQAKQEEQSYQIEYRRTNLMMVR